MHSSVIDEFNSSEEDYDGCGDHGHCSNKAVCDIGSAGTSEVNSAKHKEPQTHRDHQFVF